jgi:transposase
VGEQDRIGLFIGPVWLHERFGSIHKEGSRKMTQHSTVAAGIDTAKAKLDVAITGHSKCWQVCNAVAGWQDLIAVLRQHEVRRVGIEATGGYEQGVVRQLRKAGFEVLIIQPIQLRAFARLSLRRAKNDRLDAALIAAFVASREHIREAPDQRLAPLSELLTAIEQNEEDSARIKVRFEHIHDPWLRRTMLSDVKRLKLRRAGLMARLAAALQRHDDIRKRLDLVQSIPGIGLRTALSLIVRMPELGSITREQAAALAGLAPFDRDSGKYRGERHIAGGRKRPRRSLYTAALSAAFLWNPALKAMYQRLVQRGKAHNQALIACARKLLIYANTVLARGTPWVPAS